MKVLIITNLYPLPWEPNRGVFNKHQFSWLERSNELKIVVLVSWLDALRNYSSLRASKSAGNVSYLPYFYTPRFLRVLYPLFIFLGLMMNLGNYRRFQPECLLCSWAFPDAVAGTLLARLLRVPTIIKVHGSDINEYLKFPLRRTQILWAVSKASAVVSVSKALKNCLVAHGAEGSSIQVVYNGVDKSIFRSMDYNDVCGQLGVAPERKRILYVGNLKKAKGCLELLDAFTDVAAQNNECDLVYIGKGICDKAIRDGMNEFAPGRVVLLGALPQAEIAKWMNASWVVTLPSENEGVPNVLLEAMSCGVQVVASNVGGIPEIVDPGAGLVYQQGDRSALVNCLLTALEQRKDGAVIANTVSDFTWERNEAEMNKIMAAVV